MAYLVRKGALDTPSTTGIEEEGRVRREEKRRLPSFAPLGRSLPQPDLLPVMTLLIGFLSVHHRF